MQEEIEKIINQAKKETDFFNKAKILELLRKKKDVSLMYLSTRMNLKPQHLCQIIRLNRLPEIITDGFYSKLVSLSHLFILSRIKDKKKIIQAYEKILTNNLTTHQTEQLVREILYEVQTTNDRLTEEEKENIIKKIVQGEKNIAVKIIQTRIRSRLIIEIKGDLEKTTNLLRKILGLFNL